MTLSASLTPSGNFDLSSWKITLPVDSSGGITGTAMEVLKLSGYTQSSYFYTGSTGAMTFRAPVDGATTSGSNYARSELREMNGSSGAAWNLSTGGSMTATLSVDQIPTRFDGTMGKVVVGQIHGSNDELVRLYWDAGKMYFANDLSGTDNTEHKFYFADAAGNQPDVSLGEKFSYVISAHGSALDVDVYADGNIYHSHTAINSIWQGDSLYFKAGAYLGVNETQGTGFGQDSFYDLRFTHGSTDLTPLALGSTGGSTTGTTSGTTGTTTPTAPVVAGLTLNGTDSANTITGGEGSDTIDAKRGNDTVYGLGGNDTIYGGTGTDNLYGGAGSDTLYGQDGWDTLIGGSQADVLYGGAGGDTFKFTALSDSTASATDIIMDWSSSQKDKISLSGIDANSLLSGDQAFKFIGSAAFGHVAGELHTYQSGGHTFIEGDVNGDGLGDFLIQIHTATTLTSADFVL